MDDAHNLAAISRVAQAENVIIPLYLDLNVGMNRTGIVPGLEATELYRSMCRTAGVQAAGLHAYDGHLRDADHHALAQVTEQTFAPVWQMREQLRAEGFAVPGVIASGSPTFALLAQRGDVEVGAGTTVLWDFGQQQISPEHHFLNAALVCASACRSP